MTSPLVQQTKWQPYWKMWWQVVDQEQQVRREIQNQLWWQIDATITDQIWFSLISRLTETDGPR